MNIRGKRCTGRGVENGAWGVPTPPRCHPPPATGCSLKPLPGSDTSFEAYRVVEPWLEKLLVLDHSACSSKTLQTGWFINNRNVLLTVREAGSLRSEHQHGQVRALLWSQTPCSVPKQG